MKYFTLNAFCCSHGLCIMYNIGCYLDDDGVVEWLFPEEDEWRFELRVQRVLLRLRPGFLVLTVDIHIRVSTWHENKGRYLEKQSKVNSRYNSLNLPLVSR